MAQKEFLGRNAQKGSIMHIAVEVKYKVATIRYESKDNDFKIVTARVLKHTILDDKKNTHNEDNAPSLNNRILTFKGEFHKLKVDDVFVGEGIVKVSSYDKEPEFQMSFSGLVISGDEDSVYSFVKNHIKGLGEKKAKELLAIFGTQLLEILRLHPEKIAALKGFSMKRALEFQSQMMEHIIFDKVYVFLKQHGISSAKALKLYNVLGSKVLEVIKTNP